MENIVVLTRENYENYLPIQVKAFSFAEGGAMGYPGEFIIVENHDKIFKFNIITFECNRAEIEKIIPLYYECRFGLFGRYDLPDGWVGFYLGAGNHLIIHASIREKFMEKAQNCQGLYSNWQKIVVDILQEG